MPTCVPTCGKQAARERAPHDPAPAYPYACPPPLCPLLPSPAGAMYQRQLRRHLERATSAHSAPPAATNPRLSRRLSSGKASGRTASQDSSRHSTLGGGQPSLAAGLPEEPEEEAGPGAGQGGCEHPDAVETCPAAVGAAWLPQLLHRLGAAPQPLTTSGRTGSTAAGQAAAKPLRRLAGGTERLQPARSAAPGGLDDAAAASSKRSSSPAGASGHELPVMASSGSASLHPTLAHVRSLFDAGVAEERAADSGGAGGA